MPICSSIVEIQTAYYLWGFSGFVIFSPFISALQWIMWEIDGIVKENGLSLFFSIKAFAFWV
jgi:hypothetical protein